MENRKMQTKKKTIPPISDKNTFLSLGKDVGTKRCPRASAGGRLEAQAKAFFNHSS